MRAFDAPIAAHINDGRWTVFHICQIDGASTYRFTDAPMDIIWGGFTWSHATSFATGEFVLDSDGNLAGSVIFEDITQTIRTIAEVEDFQDRLLRVWEVWADDTGTVYGQDLKIQGLTDGCSCTGLDGPNPQATIAIRSVFAASADSIGPSQDYTRNCRYPEFKGPQCGAVTVATTCDRLFSTCVSFGNQARFGGMRWALAIGTTVQFGIKTATATARAVNPVATQPVVGATPIPPPPPRTRAAGGK